MPVSVYIATSLDGFIADKNNGLDWLNNFPNPRNDDYGFADFMMRIDAIVMGRNTYEAVLSFGGEWPYVRPVFVLSSKLSTVPENLRENVQIISGSCARIVDTMKRKGFERLYVDGGRTVQTFLKDDLVDEMIISTLPLLLGGGTPLFGILDGVMNFRHVRTQSFDSGIVQSRYARER